MTDERHVRITVVDEFSSSLVLHTLSAGIGSVVDWELVLAHEQDGDLGAAWPQTNSAGSGPYRLRSWQADESVVLEANSAMVRRACCASSCATRPSRPSSGCCWKRRCRPGPRPHPRPGRGTRRQRTGTCRHPPARHVDLPGGKLGAPHSRQPVGGASAAPRGRLPPTGVNRLTPQHPSLSVCSQAK